MRKPAARIRTLPDLARELERLRRRAARPGQLRLSVRDIAARTGRAASTLDPYLRGRRLCPADVYEEILRALEVPQLEFRPWLDAWDRLADAAGGDRQASTPARRIAPEGATARPVAYTERIHYEVVIPDTEGHRIGIVAGDLRRVRCAEVWVNPENTNMRMARFEEHSTSAIIRYEGALRDETGHVVHDHIAAELSRKVARREPVAPGTAITTGPGELARSNDVRYLIHVAAVHGEPGEGYRQILDIGRCITSSLAEVARLNAEPDERAVGRLRTILFPLLGAGQGRGDPESTATALLGAALDWFAGAVANKHTVDTVYFLAYTDHELGIWRRVCDASSLLVREEPT